MKAKWIHRTAPHVTLYAYDDYSVEWFQYDSHCRASELPNGAGGPHHEMRLMAYPLANTSYVHVNDSFHKAWLPCWWVQA